MDNKRIVNIAYQNEFVIPAFNIPNLPMVKPVVQAVAEEGSFAFIQVARLEWEKFNSGSLKAVYNEYKKWEDVKHVSIHLDHVPVIDEDKKEVDYLSIIQEAIEVVGYKSVMIDGSRLALDENINATKQICSLAHKNNVACEAELGSVLGHESGPLPPYEELYKTRSGFTKLDEAASFVEQSKCDWLSVAIGSIHGSISEAARGAKKPAAKLDIPYLKQLRDVTGIPLVLHGGSGIQKEYILRAVKNGISKINVGTEIRQAYENGLEKNGVEYGRELVYLKVRELLHDYFEISGTAKYINQE